MDGGRLRSCIYFTECQRYKSRPVGERVGADCIAENGLGALEKELTQREGLQTGQRSHPEGNVSFQHTVDLTPTVLL